VRAVVSREFGAFFIARQSAVLAYRIEEVAIGWQIFQLRHSALDLGLVGLILFLPQLLLALPAGILADRVDRRAICVVTSCVEAIGLGGFVTLIALRVHSVPVYLSAVLFIGIAHTAGTPAERSLLVNIVPSERFVRAQGIVSTFTQLSTIAGPALGGVLISAGTAIAFGASGAAYVLAAIAFSFLNRHEVEYVDEPVSRAAMEGLHFIFNQRIILAAISLDLFAVLFGGSTALLPIFATTILHVGPTGFGLLRAAPSIGAALVAVYVARHSIHRGMGRLLLACVTGFGVATIVFGLSRNFVLSLMMYVLAGGFDMVSVFIRSAIVQLRTPNVMRGRVLAVENVFIGASNELGAFESGGVAALIGAPGSVVLGGVATIVVIALWSAMFPELRRFDTIEE
jgi:MFS family permease